MLLHHSPELLEFFWNLLSQCFWTSKLYKSFVVPTVNQRPPETHADINNNDKIMALLWYNICLWFCSMEKPSTKSYHTANKHKHKPRNLCACKKPCFKSRAAALSVCIHFKVPVWYFLRSLDINPAIDVEEEDITLVRTKAVSLNFGYLPIYQEGSMLLC